MKKPRITVTCIAGRWVYKYFFKAMPSVIVYDAPFMWCDLSTLDLNEFK